MDIIEYDGLSQRIDSFLTKHLSYSRNFFQHLISRGAILVNGKEVKKSYSLKAGDNIQIESMERFLGSDVLQESPNIDLEIKIEKNDYLVVYKPKGVLSHPNSVWDVKSPSVAGFLYHKYKQLPSIGNFVRAGLIHRLDKNTNGFMIVAKTERGLEYFKSLFQDKSLSISIDAKESINLKKYYRCKVIPTSQGMDFLKSIENELPYYIQELVKTKNSYSKDYKMGITKILGFDIEGNIVNMDIEILTGRTHQIRYHMSSKGLPIIGDELYGQMYNDMPMQLENYRLEFLDIDSQPQIITL